MPRFFSTFLTLTSPTLPSRDLQEQFDQFYNNALYLLNHFYPERTITLTSRDPEFVTPAIKTSLRRKNRLMHAGRIEEANALAAGASIPMGQGGHVPIPNIYEGGDIHGNVPPIF